MPRRLITTIVLFWLVSGMIAGGAINAYFRGEFPLLYSSEQFARIHCGQNFAIGVFGPASLIMTAFMSGFFYHGLSFSCHALEHK